MSLNRAEQLVLDYVQKHPEERHYWMGKVRSAALRLADEHAVAGLLEAELWRYFEERAGVATPFREFVRVEGRAKTSMRNLAEYLVKLWSPPRPKKTQVGGTSS